MKSITVHGLDDDLDAGIRDRARTEGLSLNKTIKLLVRQALGIGERPPDRRGDFQDFLGIWTAAEVEAFDLATQGFDQVDDADWK